MCFLQFKPPSTPFSSPFVIPGRSEMIICVQGAPDAQDQKFKGSKVNRLPAVLPSFSVCRLLPSLTCYLIFLCSLFFENILVSKRN